MIEFHDRRIYTPITDHVAKAVQGGKVRQVETIAKYYGGFISGTPNPGENQLHQRVSVRPKRDATIVERPFLSDEPDGDEDITWRTHPQLGEYVEVHRPRAVEDLQAHIAHTPERAQREMKKRSGGLGNGNFHHWTGPEQAEQIMDRVRRNKPGLLLSEHGDVGGGIYLNGDPTAWRHAGSVRIEAELYGHRAIGMGPGGDRPSLYTPDPDRLASHRFKQGQRGQRYDSNTNKPIRESPQFFRERGYDIVVTGGKETVATHPLQVRVVGAHSDDGRLSEQFAPTYHRHYKHTLPITDKDFSPRTFGK